jgi:spore germination protein YaaH
MKRALIALVVLCAAVAQAATPHKPALTTLMYLVNRPASIASFQQNWRQISIIAPQCFTMDAEGFVSGEVPATVLEAARAHGVALMPLVTNLKFNQPLMHTVLDTPALRARAIRYLLYYALRDGYIGFQFDYENIHYTYRERFTTFFHEAAREFHRHGLLLTAAVVGKYSDDRNSESPGGFDNWSGVYDYRRLGKDADFLSIMAYPQHAGFSGPGPLAGYPWVQKIVEFTRSSMPPRKISLGIPLYGFHWTALAPGEKPGQAAFVQDNAGPAVKKWKGQSLTFDTARQLHAKAQPEWNETERAHRVVFTEADGQHEAWYEDARSLTPKLQLATERRLAGVSGWVLGQEDPELWQVLARDFRVIHPRTPKISGTPEQQAKLAARKLRAKKK